MEIKQTARKYWYVIAAGIILFMPAIMFFTSCENSTGVFKNEWMDEFQRAATGVGIPKRDLMFKHDYTTPKGAHVKSVVEIPPDFLNAADEGLTGMIERHFAVPEFSGWTKGRQHSEYTITVIEPSVNDLTGERCMAADIPNAPCVFVGGYKSAGTVLGVDELWEEIDARPALVVAHQQKENWQNRTWFRNAVWVESEHYNEWLNRHNPPTGIFYNFVGPNDVHLHFGQWPADAVGLLNRNTKFECAFTPNAFVPK